MTQDRAQLLITAVDQTRSAFDSIRGNLAKLGNESNRVKGLLAGLGVSLSVAGFAAMIKNAIDAADQLNKLSQKIGISVEALSTLRFAAQLSDVSLETLQKGIKGLSQNIAEANTGIGDGAQVFDALGISVKNADGSMKSTEAVLLQMADVFANLEDGAVKTALAVKLFGKSGMDMIPFLNQGAAGINQLTAEAERLGLKLTTETARSAEAFNDNLTALKASSSSLGIALARDFLPELTNITNAMREAANEAGTLKALWVGLGGVGNLIFNGTEIKQARDEIKRIQELVDSTRTKVDSGKAPVPFMPFDVKFNEGAMATLRKNLAQWEQELAGAKKRLDDLTSPKRPEEKTPTGKPTEDMQRIACVVSGGQWVNGKCEKKATGGTEKDTTGAQLAVVKAQAESEFKVLKESLDLQKTALDRSLDDRLVSVRDYYARKTQIEQQAIDQELAAKQQELRAQSTVAVGGKDEAQRLRAKAEVKKLEGEIIVLNMKRGDVEIINAHAAAKAEKELADELARVRDRMAEIRGGAGGDVTRARLEREYQPLIEKLQLMGDTTGAADVGRLINVEADMAELAKLERQYQNVTDRMSIRERELQVQKDAGMISEAQMRREVLALHQQTATEVDGMIPKMQALATATGSEEAINRVARLKVEVAGLKTVADDVATRINGDVENAFTTMFEQIGSGAKSASDAFGDFARSVLSAINRIAAQKIAEGLFGSMTKGGSGGLGGLISGLFQSAGFASGGYVTGPGTGTSDSIPARLSAGEYVLRADAVRRVGIEFLHALNGGLFTPRWSGQRLAFADGGLVPAVSPATAAAPSQSVRIVNVIDPGMAADYLNSAAGEKTILNVLSRNGSAVRELLR
ncbi:phage tail protein [Hydrogenophaga defluvii]|uniref:Phage tail protein n=1 Tax=Hydrogenophaga defluvii TaxID=249410 RepID=A0ABW2SAF7_9BURK